MNRAARDGLAAFGLSLLLAPAGFGQTPTPKTFVERVDVVVRTILVRITDAEGRAPTPPPRPEDLELLEDGRPVQIIDIDPVRSPVTSRPDADEPWAPSAAASSGVPQHLYVDAAMLQSGSVARLVKIFENNLDAVLANGSLEIVVADPIPRQTLAATRQPEAVREALRVLGREVAGKQTLIQLRRQTVVTLRYSFTENLAMLTRLAAEQELRLIRDSLDRLVRWAGTLGDGRPDVVYFGTDGFDSDVTETYRRIVQQLTTVPPPALVVQSKSPAQIDRDLQTEFTQAGGDLVASAARSLAAFGVEAIPLVLGGGLREFGDDASVEGQQLGRSSSGAVPLFARPVDPLRTIAEVTGGEVVTSSSQLPAVLGTFDDAYLVSFRSAQIADGRVREVKITSRRPGLSVRGRGYAAEGPADSIARGETVRALRQPATPSELAVHISIGSVSRETEKYRGLLRVDVDLQPIVGILDGFGGGLLRLTIAVEVEDAKEPFTANQEFRVERGQPGWGADVPLAWPLNARRIAVTIEELQTGMRGTATADLTRPQ